METKFRESDVPESNLEPVIIPLDASDTEEESGDDDEADDEDEGEKIFGVQVKRSSRHVNLRLLRTCISRACLVLGSDALELCAGAGQVKVLVLIVFLEVRSDSILFGRNLYDVCLW
ncbi:hypothetical protein HPB47_014857 [Ixodes persulcatus]|uniref:Uncharacterized protein n=1 Tax=Ixodes persulcatus TaxID=34615 RepID=A0AC60QUX6_IXOPE|nr:hypothetical protein HPB47_014857 [Ixodes persulcatus]